MNGTPNQIEKKLKIGYPLSKNRTILLKLRIPGRGKHATPQLLADLTQLTMTSKVKREEVKFVAEVRKKKYRDGYIISLKGEKGGPVLGGKDLKKLKEDFHEALNASVALTSLFAFKEEDDDKAKKGREDSLNLEFEGDDLAEV